MTAENFVYWLQGFLEIKGEDGKKDIQLSTEQVEIIKDHINLVLTKVTKSVTKDTWGDTLGELQESIKKPGTYFKPPEVTCDIGIIDYHTTDKHSLECSKTDSIEGIASGDISSLGRILTC